MNVLQFTDFSAASGASLQLEWQSVLKAVGKIRFSLIATLHEGLKRSLKLSTTP
jgi:hypothetical protein